MTTGSTSAGEGKGGPEEGGVPYQHPQWIRDEAEAVSRDGFVNNGDWIGAVRALVPEAESTHAKIEKLMEGGVPEEEAKERAVAEAVGEIEGKEKNYPDIAAYIRDQKKKMDEYRIVLDGVPEAVSRWFAKGGDYFRVSIPLHDGGGDSDTVGVAYLSKDNTIRFLCYPPNNCMIGGKISGGRLSTSDLALCGFNEVTGDTLTARDWFRGRLEKEAAKRNSEKAQKRSQGFEF